MAKKIIAVFGATGAQGGGLARAILNDKQSEFSVRAITRGLKHVIWSTLEDTRNWVPLDDDRMPTLRGKYKVPHFDSKGEADKLFTELGVPTTFLRASFYWDNFIYFGSGPKKDLTENCT
jgi:uncharacterized protein YbjT (DUF2867 family)